MKHLSPIIWIASGILFFFLGSSFIMEKDKTWADTGVAYTAYVLSALSIIFGIHSLVKKD